MMNQAAVGLLIICSFVFSTAQSSVMEQMNQQNFRVLSGRLHKALEFRLQGLYDCEFETQVQIEKEFQRFPLYSDQRENSVDLINFYRKTYQVSPSCLLKLNSNEKKFAAAERQKFKLVNQLSPVKELDPHCNSVQVPNSFNSYDAFPCMAGDQLIVKSLTKNRPTMALISENINFIQNLRSAFSQSLETGQTVELYPLFLGQRADSSEMREKFLATMAMLMSSTSSLHSYIQDYHYELFLKALKESQVSEQALDFFLQAKLVVDHWRTLSAWAQSKKIGFTLAQQDIRTINYHDVMSAFLACQDRTKPKIISQGLPILMGYAYEAYDFQAHLLKDKIGLKAAVQNFKKDTARHITGSQWGSYFCKM